jgi:hypothetical protein
MWTLLAALALAANPDFSGSWSLDLAASDSVDPILAAQGVGWAERQAAKSLTATQHIRQSTSTLTIDIESAVIDKTEVLPLDGSPQSGTTRDGKPRVARTTWQGSALVTTAVVTAPEGAQQMTLARTLEDGNNTLRQHITLKLADGTTYEVDRIYRRVK